MSKELQEQLAVKVKAFEDALADAEAFATEHKLSFSISPAYGMGGRFNGANVGKLDSYGDERDGWLASSQSC